MRASHRTIRACHHTIRVGHNLITADYLLYYSMVLHNDSTLRQNSRTDFGSFGVFGGVGDGGSIRAGLAYDSSLLLFCRRCLVGIGVILCSYHHATPEAVFYFVNGLQAEPFPHRRNSEKLSLVESLHFFRLLQLHHCVRKVFTKLCVLAFSTYRAVCVPGAEISSCTFYIILQLAP